MAKENGFQLKGFIRVTLTDKQKEDGKKGDPFEAFDEWAGELFQKGYKLSLSYDAENDCFYATLTATSADNEFRGYALSGRGPSAAGSLQMLLAKHFTVLKGNWTNAKETEGGGWG